MPILDSLHERTSCLDGDLAPIGEVLTYVVRVARTREICLSAVGARQLLHEGLDAISAGHSDVATVAGHILARVDALELDGESGTNALGVLLVAVEAVATK